MLVSAGYPLEILLSFRLAHCFILLETSVSKESNKLFIDVGVVFSDITFFSIAYFGASRLSQKINQPFCAWGGLLASWRRCLFLKHIKKRKKQQKGKVKIIQS